MTRPWVFPLVLFLAVIAACQTDAGQATGQTTVAETGFPTSEPVRQTESILATTEAPESGSVRQAERSLSGMSMTGIRVPVRPPRDAQELLDRADFIAVGTISAVSDTVEEGPYGVDLEEYKAETGLPAPTILVTYYQIQVEETLLDDGNWSSYPFLRLAGRHGPTAPQIGERYMFALAAEPDSKSYSASAGWGLIIFGDGPVRHFDGTPLNFDGVTSQEELKSLVSSAVPNRVKIPPKEWMNR